MPKSPTPRKATPRSLENAALHYVGRFAATAESLRRVLMRRVERSARAHGTNRAEAAAWAEDIVARFVRSGLVDDAAFAEARAATLHRRGTARRVIRLRLLEKGVDEDTIKGALVALGEDTADSERQAAVNLARRRRLGPFRVAEDRSTHREKDLAALARAGFGYDVARKVVDAERADDL